VIYPKGNVPNGVLINKINDIIIIIDKEKEDIV